MPLQDTGYVVTSFEDRQAELREAFRGKFGQGVKVGPSSNFGKIIDVMADREVSTDEGGQLAYESAFLATASGPSLDRKAFDVAGIRRKAATYSTGTVYARGDSGLTVPAGTRFATVDAGDQFEVTEDTNLLTIADQTASSVTRSGSTVTVNKNTHGYLAGDWVFITGATQGDYNGLWQVATAAANSFTYEIDTTPVTPATGTVTIHAASPLPVQATTTGPVAALAGVLTDIVDAVTGLDAVENAEDITEGTDIESNAELRARASTSPGARGKATNSAIRAAILALDNVTSCTVTENDTDATDGDGRPAHSFEAVVVGGTNQDIGDAIWDTKAAGIKAYGSVAVNVTDDDGNTQSVSFSRPTEIDIWVEITVTTNSDFPTGGSDAVKAAILAYGDTLSPGDDVIVFPALMSYIADVAGITDVVIDIAGVPDGDPDPGPTLDDNVVIAANEIAIFDSSRITVTVV